MTTLILNQGITQVTAMLVPNNRAKGRYFKKLIELRYSRMDQVKFVEDSL